MESAPEGNNGALTVGHGVLDDLPPQKTNGTAAIVALSPAKTIASGNGVDVTTWTDPCAAGQVEACAALRATESDVIEPPLEDKWSKRKTYNSLQVLVTDIDGSDVTGRWVCRGRSKCGPLPFPSFCSSGGRIRVSAIPETASLLKPSQKRERNWQHGYGRNW